MTLVHYLALSFGSDLPSPFLPFSLILGFWSGFILCYVCFSKIFPIIWLFFSFVLSWIHLNFLIIICDIFLIIKFCLIDQVSRGSLLYAHMPLLYLALEHNFLIKKKSFTCLFWLHWVFIAMHRHSSSCGKQTLLSSCGGWASHCVTSLVEHRFKGTCSVVVAHGPHCPMACGVFLDQGLKLCPLHWQADS